MCAFQFNGTDQYAYWTLTEVAAPRSYSVWFKPVASNNANDMIWWEGRANESAPDAYYLMTRGTGDTIGFGRNSSSATQWADTTNTITAGQWHHVVGIVTTTSDAACVLDGDWANRGTNTATKTPSSLGRTSVGAIGDDNPSNYIAADIAELTIWDFAIEQGHAEMLAAGFPSTSIRPDKLRFYAPMVTDYNDRIFGRTVTTS